MLFALGRISKRTVFWSVFAVVMVAVYLLWSLVLATDSRVPDSFLEANRSGALIASQIVDLSAVSGNNLQRINELDREGKAGEAIELVREEMKRTGELQQKAYDLSLELRKMTEVLPEITPRAATDTALRAINYETALIIRLLNYGRFLNELLSVLQNKFDGGVVEPDRVSFVVKKINDEVTAINDLNKQYQDAIEKLKSITAQ